MRVLKFAGVFLGTLLLVFLIVFGFNTKALFTLFENHKGIKEGQEWVAKTNSLKGLTKYIGAQPDRVSIASLDLTQPDSSLYYNVHTPRTMGRLSMLFVVIEYAREVERSELNPKQQIPLQKVNRYQLPYMYQSNHSDALNNLQQNGEISARKTVALGDLIQTSVEYNDMAISDYLQFKIGRSKIENLMDTLSLQDTELPLPLSGLYIALNPYLEHRTAKAQMDSLSQLSRAAFDQLVLQNTHRFINQKAYHERVLNQFRDEEGLGIQFTRQRDALAFFPKTTASEMAGIMKQLQQNTLISTGVSQKVKQILSWPMRNSHIKSHFKSYGALYDNRMGMVNGINFGISSNGNDAFAQAVFFDDLQVAFWFHMSSNLMHEDFIQRLIWDSALRNATKKAISKSQMHHKTEHE